MSELSGCAIFGSQIILKLWKDRPKPSHHLNSLAINDSEHASQHSQRTAAAPADGKFQLGINAPASQLQRPVSRTSQSPGTHNMTFVSHVTANQDQRDHPGSFERRLVEQPVNTRRNRFEKIGIWPNEVISGNLVSGTALTKL